MSCSVQDYGCSGPFATYAPALKVVVAVEIRSPSPRPNDLAMIDAQLGEMKWDRARLDAFLQSSSSPLGEKRRSNPQLRTVGDVNCVLWALRGIAAHEVKAEVQP